MLTTKTSGQLNADMAECSFVAIVIRGFLFVGLDATLHKAQ